MQENQFETGIEVNETVNTETKNKSKLSKGKTALIIIVAVVYTAVVSLVSSVITKNIVEYKENQIAQERIEEEKKKKKEEEEKATGSNKVEIIMDDDSKADLNNQDDPLNGNFEDDVPPVKPDGKSIVFDKPITAGDVMEITFTSWEWCDEILPADTSDYYNYYDDKAGEKYIVLKGTIKNTSAKEYSLNDVVGMITTVNGKYEISSATAAIESADGTGFSSYEDIKSLQTLDFVIFVSYADGVYDECQNVKFDLELFNDSNEIGEYYYNDDKKPVDKYSLVVDKA